jgi:hypothetical protein
MPLSRVTISGNRASTRPQPSSRVLCTMASKRRTCSPLLYAFRVKVPKCTLHERQVIARCLDHDRQPRVHWVAAVLCRLGRVCGLGAAGSGWLAVRSRRLHPPATGRGAQPEGGEAGQVDRSSQQLEVLGHAHQPPGPSSAVAAAQQAVRSPSSVGATTASPVAAGGDFGRADDLAVRGRPPRGPCRRRTRTRWSCARGGLGVDGGGDPVGCGRCKENFGARHHLAE